MIKKLEELHAAVERSPENVENFHRLIMKYQIEIGKNTDKIKDSKTMTARVESVLMAIDRKKAELKKEKIIDTKNKKAA